MNAKQLWNKLIEEHTGVLDPTGCILTPNRDYKIDGSVVESLIKDEKERITINLKHIDVINHEGENIDYSLYGTPKNTWETK